tara:strand:- start:415 stop:981 length:567 start_codon:yes stop_codon:yes gene_type:complete
MVGILALQGNYQMHFEMLKSLNVESMFVKTSEDLLNCNSLVIPGGESTVMSKMMTRYNLFDSIKEFSINHSVFGTCAGLILMANSTLTNIKTLSIIDVDVSRNAWGRQINSFTDDIIVDIDKPKNYKATFIRAPKIKNQAKAVQTLGKLKKEPVMIRQGRHLATTFHPEMHGDTLIHEYFLNMAGVLG